MQEEGQPRDPTRRLLRVFGVKVTQYEERMGALIEQAQSLRGGQTEDRLRAALEALALTEDLNQRLSEMYAHVFETQRRKLADLQVALGQTEAGTDGSASPDA
jgi:hypothetical protein